MPIDLVTGAKILGLIIFNDLKWNCHIDFIIKKAKKPLYGLSQLKRSGVGSHELVQFFRIYICPMKCMNEWAAIPLSFIVPFERFNGSIGSFCFSFFKDFQHIDWICYSRLTWLLMASNVSGLQEHDTSHGSSKVQVTILASEWGSSKGGLSTINRELAIQLAKFSCLEVTLFLPKCSDEDKKVADSHGISIVEAMRRLGYSKLDWLSFPPEHLTVDVVVGHGAKLGYQAQVIRDSHNCKRVQVVHTDPEELGMFKHYENPISMGEEKHHGEVELCRMADFVVGVGPKLAEAFRKNLGFCKKRQDVFEFTPGIFDEFSSVQQVPDERKECSVLGFGRGDGEDFKLKGFDIAARSVAALSDTILVFVGAPHGKQEKIANRFIRFGITADCLRVRSYVSRESLKKLFCEVDVVLMPSRTEGFGLTGLEALSAGLSVLVSKNSGFGEALGSVPCGSLFVIADEDPSAWRVAIKRIWNKDRKSRLDEVKTLRDFYAERYSWSEQCKHLMEKMVELVDGMN